MKKFLTFSFILFSIFVFAYTFYRSEIVWSGGNRNFYLKYYLISVILLILSTSNLYLNKSITAYLNIICISVFLSLYTFETYLTLQKNELKFIDQKKLIYKNKTGLDYDARTRQEIYEDLKKTHDDVSLSIYSITNPKTGFYSLSGKSLSKTIMCNENGYYPIINSDRYGFNNPDYEWTNKTQDILIAGDSFAYGACVNRPDDIASVIRRKTKRGVISLGLPANGPLRELASIKEYSTQKVNLIIWIYFEGNDLEGLGYEIENKTLKKYLINREFTQDLKNRQKEIDKMVEKKILSERVNTFKFKRFLKLSNLRNKISNIRNKKKDNLKNFEAIIEEALFFAKIKKAKLFFVYLPEYNRYSTKNYSNKNYNKIKKIVLNKKIIFVDVSKKIFDKEKNPLSMFPFALPGNHYTKDTYEKISDLIISNITKYE